MNASNAEPSVALVYDYVTTSFGGAEVVLDQLHQLYPSAPLFTTVADLDRAYWAKDWQIITTFLQKLPLFLRRRHQWQALLAPVATETLDLSGFDIIISVSAGNSKGVITLPHQLHLCYVLTPTRYLYDKKSLVGHHIFSFRLLRKTAVQLLRYLRWWDQAAAHRPDYVLAISRLVARRIQSNYGIKSWAVIYPPFRQRAAVHSKLESEHFPEHPYDLVISRLVGYKKVDIAVRAAVKAKSRLVIVGEGPSLGALQRLAGPQGTVKKSSESLVDFFKRGTEQGTSIYFTGSLNDDESTALLHHCRCLLMVGQEDFGMTPLEALSLGKPIIIDASSGVAELLEDGKHGFLLQKVTSETVAAALSKLEESIFSTALLKRTALRYSDSVFRHTFATAVKALWQEHKEHYGITA